MRRSECSDDVTETRLRWCAAVLGALGWLAVSVLPAHAVTLYVGNNGNDGFFPPCGAATTPCRSIGKAISLANPNDTILVGPGVYGDLNGNGTFEPASGEENAEIGSGCECMLKVEIPLTIKSRDGARVTVLDAGGLTQNVVHITAPGADGTTFGMPNKGFTIRNGSLNGVLTDASATKVKVQGNIATGNVNGFNISGVGGGANTVKVLNNIARGNGTGFLLAGTSNVMQHNRALRNSTGFDISGGTHTVTQNVAAQNSGGFAIALSAGNTNPLLSFSTNSAISNTGSGIAVNATSALNSNVIIKKSNMYGNADPSASNCGLVLNNGDGANTLKVIATGNFWGASTGPGANPADVACNTGVGPLMLTTTPFAVKEFGVSEAALK